MSGLLQNDSCARVFYVSQPRYDTHARQQFTHANLLAEFSQALKAFLDDLRNARLEERVVVLAFSEFGRRVADNDSLGTDHGAADPVFVAGAPVHGGVLGEAPDLANLDKGDLQKSFDFRQVYATLLDERLSVDSRFVLSADFTKLQLFAAHS